MARKRNTKGRADAVDEHVGRRIRTRRVGLGISQTALGAAINVTFQQVQKYENGTNRIGAGNLYKLAEALSTDVGYFYGGLEGMPPSRGHGPGLADPGAVGLEGDPMGTREAIELVHNYYRIADPNLRKRIFQFIKSLAHQFVKSPTDSEKVS